MGIQPTTKYGDPGGDYVSGHFNGRRAAAEAVVGPVTELERQRDELVAVCKRALRTLEDATLGGPLVQRNAEASGLWDFDGTKRDLRRVTAAAEGRLL